MANIDEAAVSIQAEIERLEQRLQELLSDAPVMDDEVNAVERDCAGGQGGGATEALVAKITAFSCNPEA